MREIWTLSKPMVVAVKRVDGTTLMAKASAVLVVETIGFPENGLQQVLIGGYISATGQDNQVWELDAAKPADQQKPVLQEIAVRNVIGKSTIK